MRLVDEKPIGREKKKRDFGRQQGGKRMRHSLAVISVDGFGHLACDEVLPVSYVPGYDLLQGQAAQLGAQGVHETPATRKAVCAGPAQQGITYEKIPRH